MRQKEELRKEKEAERRKAALEKAHARKIAKESMELIEDEQLEMMELAASSKGLSSIIRLDFDTLQNIDSFRGEIYFVILNQNHLVVQYLSGDGDIKKENEFQVLKPCYYIVGSLCVFPPENVKLRKPFAIQPWINSEENVGNLLMVCSHRDFCFLITSYTVRHF
jgi:hypothetical protein